MTDMATTWSPDPQRFIADLEGKPQALDALASSADVRNAVASVPRQPSSVLLLGMGSSRFAAEDAARRLRSMGHHAVSEYASAELLPPARPELLAVGISASGSSGETLAAMERYRGAARTVAVTERTDSALADICDITIPLVAGHETGGVACRSFQHTGLVLRLLEAHLVHGDLDFAGLCRRVAEGSSELLRRRPEWLAAVTAALDTNGMIGVIAPAERWSCAAQSALMFREGPRRAAVGAETGDWSHIDVYLTKTIDYRALLMTGSRYDEEAIDWLRRRGSTVVTLGRKRDAGPLGLRHAYSDDPIVAVHVDTLVAELVAARIWRGQSR